jgi:hypothetical protein
MEFIGELEDVSKDIVHGGYKITFSCTDLPNSINECTNMKLRVVAKKNSHKRSLDANAYCWLLMSKIAEKVRSDKDAVYEQMLQKYGQAFVDDAGHPQAISVEESINVSKFGLHVKFIGQGHVQDKLFSHYIVLRGSSEYDTKEMSVFIDGVVSEAKELNIDTVPVCELEKIKEKWHI